MKELSVAIKAAREAGKILMKYSNRNKGVKFKTSSRDIVTKADIESNDKIISIIKKEFPNHGILSEESGGNIESESLWIIDPIDGTTNFSYNLPHFCISIGFQKKNELIIGVVFDPSKNEMFYAEKDRGAYLNGKRIKTSNESRISRCLFGTDSHSNLDVRKKAFDVMRNAALKVRDIRHPGSAALDMCYVACARLDACWLGRPNAWDVAAGAVIVREAGGIATNVKGDEWAIRHSNIVASNGRMHEDVLKLVRVI